MENNKEQILIKALQLNEQGRPVQEILDLFPEHKTDLREMFEMMDILTKEKNQIKPSKELLLKIISQITSEKTKVTTNEIDRYSYHKGRLINLSQVHNMMWKIFLPIGAIAVIALFMVSQYGMQAPQYVKNLIPGISQEENVPEATGNVDDIIAALLKDLTMEQTAFAAEDESASLIESDSEAISDFGQNSYEYENEF
jgi:hypothetical protein